MKFPLELTRLGYHDARARFYALSLLSPGNLGLTLLFFRSLFLGLYKEMYTIDNNLYGTQWSQH